MTIVVLCYPLTMDTLQHCVGWLNTANPTIRDNIFMITNKYFKAPAPASLTGFTHH